VKIAIISSNEQSTPPPENTIIASMLISSLQSRELAKRGHTIYSIVGKGSSIKTNPIFSSSYPVFETINKKAWENTNDSRLMYQLIVPFETDLHLTLLDFLQHNNVDLVHFHSIKPYMGLPFAQRISQPCFFTLHSPGTPLEIEVMKNFHRHNIHYISISNNQRKSYEGLGFAGTVYNGVNIDGFTFEPQGGDDLVMAGRILPQKGINIGIDTALKTEKKLKIAGDVRPSNKEYYEKEIVPLLQNNEQIHFLSFMNYSLINPFFGNGKVSLVPIQWEEPFGLVMIESMATGTPVIAFARGSVPEIIKDGETGFIVNSSPDDIRGDWKIKKTGIEGLCEAVERIYSMEQNEYEAMRINSRKHIEKKFTSAIMAANYEHVYKQILNQQ